jgi:Glycosyl transferase family 2
MAAVSYWLLSPSFFLALAGKIRGWDRTVSTPVREWRTAKVDVVIPARNEQRNIALALDSLLRQDFPIRRIIVIDDASTDCTPEIVTRFSELSGHEVALIRREKPMGKTPGIREVCQTSDADILFILDADTVLMHSDYISRTVQEMFRNASVASVCGEVMPLRPATISVAAESSRVVRQLAAEFGSAIGGAQGRWNRFLTSFTIIYRTAIYLFLHRVLYDGHSKLTGGTLNPAGCAVAYRRDRLAECFNYAGPKVGDNLSLSEDIYIGHFFNWKGYRNLHLGGIQCESTEPPVTRLGRQLFLWSSSFLQSIHYFPSLPCTIFKWPGGIFGRKNAAGAERRRIKEQYRAPWGERHTQRHGRPVGLLDFTGLVEKITFPLILLGLAIRDPQIALLTLLIEMAISSMVVALVCKPGERARGAGMMIAATPFRLLSLFVDLVAIGRFGLDLATGNRNWRK